jgi:nucleoside-diphosphate-sugar epimerase
MPRALVTGAFGFTGGHLAARLLGDGWEVRGFDLAATRERAEEWKGRESHLEAVFGDLATGEGLDEAPRGVDVVFHVASVVATSDRALAQAVIVDGTRTLAEAAARHGARRLVQISSTSVYGHGPLMNAGEDTPRRPEDPYGDGKARAEDLLLEMHARGDLEPVLLRPRLIYGPGDRHFIPTVCDNLRRGKVILINGGKAVNDFVWVGDLVDACLLAASSPRAPGRAYNVTGGEEVTSKQFFEGIADRFGLPRPKRSMPYAMAWLVAAGMTAGQRLRGQHSTSYSPLKRLRIFGNPHHFSIQRGREELGYCPSVSYSQGLQRI